jgi:sugar phosphate isomerase/epimerase
MHVSDNDGKQDLHFGIGKGSVDWQGFAKSVKRVHFRGVIMVESILDVKQSLQNLRELLS